MAVDATAHAPEKTIDVALKIWRFDSADRRARAASKYEVEAPEWVTLLDVLDLDQGPASTARSPTARAAG